MMLMQGVSNAQHRFEVCLEADGHSIYRGYGSMDAADNYAREYTGATLRFTPEDREKERGRDMGKPTMLYRIQKDGSRVAWRKYKNRDGEVIATDTQAYKDECKAQAERNAAAIEAAGNRAAKQYQTHDTDIAKTAAAMGNALGDKLTELISALQELQDGSTQPDKQPGKAAGG